MEDHENIYEKINELMGGLPAHMKVLEQKIDMDLQMEYYECSAHVRKEYDESWAFEKLPCLSEPGYSIQLKREILARLAGIEKPECFRAIQEYLKQAEEEMKAWGLLALNESRMLLESKILDESQVFISTGLGGKDEKLRYFVVLMTRSRIEMTNTQRMVIKNEFDDLIGRFDAELEEINFSGSLASLLLLLPMKHSLKSVFSAAIEECNRYGDFLNDDFIVTNVRTLTFKEIEEFLDRRNKKKKEA